MPIRITPLIDVVFILLVFFMLTSRLLPTSFLELDNSSQGGESIAGQPWPELTINVDGRVHWQEQDWPLDALLDELLRQGHVEINLTTADDTRLTDFTRTLTTLNQAGINPHWKRAAPASE